MVVGNTGNDRKYRHDDIGSIESSPKSHFYYSIFASEIAKIEKCKQCTSFIIRKSSSVFYNPFRIQEKVFFWNHLWSMYFLMTIRRHKSLTNIDKMWTCKNSYFLSWFFQYLKYHLRDTSLSIGSRYVNRLKTILWISEILTCFSYIFKRIVLDHFSIEKLIKDIFIIRIHSFWGYKSYFYYILYVLNIVIHNQFI